MNKLGQHPAVNLKSFRFAQVLAAGLTVCLCACSPEDRKPEPVHDSWYRQFETFDPAAVPVPPFLVHPVRPDAVPEAEVLLEDVAIVRLSPSEAEHLDGRQIELPTELWPFLIRGVSQGEGSFFVKQSPTALWVGHTGGGDAPMKRQPLVVALDSWSLDIYVTTGIVK
jgi:hypothetical protein